MRSGEVGLAAMLLAIGASQADAHAHLVTSTPAANATTAPVSAITMRFSEGVLAKLSGVEVMRADAAGTLVAVPATMVVAPDRKTVTVKLARPTAPGRYRVKYHVVSADTHRVANELSFTVK